MRSKVCYVLLLALWSAVAAASDTATSGPVSRGDLLKYRQVFTTADVNLFVDPTGSDSNACTSTGTAACLTIQGALNKAPKVLRHRLTVTVAAGTYGTFRVSGFVSDYGTQSTTAGILIDGALANSTLASGAATGTATGGSAGSTNTFGTLVDSGQTWTVNDLRGRFVNILTGTGAGQVRTIASNTATTITVAGTWTSPVAGSTYAVQDAATIINTCGTAPPSGGGTVSTANTAIRVQSNSAGTTVQFRALSVSAACSFGVYQPDVSTLILNRIQFTSTAGTAARVTAGGPLYIDSVSSAYSSTSGSHVIVSRALASVNASVAGNVGNTQGMGAPSGTIQNSVFINGSVGLNAAQATGPTTVFGLELVDANTTGIASGLTTNLQGVHVDCTASASAVGLLLGPSNLVSGSVSPDHVDFTDCNTAVKVMQPGGFVLSASALTATGVTTYFDVRNGGLVTLSGTPSGTVSGNEVSLDNGAVVTTFASIPSSGNCVASLDYFSRVCRD